MKVIGVERLKVFDESYTYGKEDSRAEVYRQGLWNETFHCWLMMSLFDITADGHILATETLMMDGIREVDEELGLVVDLNKIYAKGFLRDVI